MDPQALRAAAEAAWHDPDRLVDAFDATLRAGRARDAVVVAQRLVAIDPDRARATAALADATAAAGDPREAYVQLTDALHRRGLDGAWLRRRLFDLLTVLGDHEGARQQLWVALTMDANDAAAVSAWTRLYAGAGPRAVQAELVRLADTLRSGIAAARLVPAHLAGGDDDGARERVAQAVEQRDGDGRVLLELARAMEAEVRHDLVVDLVAPIVDVGGDGAALGMVVARAFAALGRRGEARRWLDRVVALDDPAVRSEVAALRMAL